MSRGKKFVALSLMTFIVIVVLGAIWGHKGGDPTGTTSTVANSYSNVFQGGSTAGIPVSQVGINQLATSTGNAGLSVNFVWVLITGFLVLFMQVGFAFLVTGLTRAKNAAHMMMMNIAAFAVALLAYYAVGFAFMFGGLQVLSLGGTTPLSGMLHIASKTNGGIIGTHGFLLQSHGSYDVGVMVLFLFEVVFMETAGYIIVGRDRRADLVCGVPARRGLHGRDHLSDLRPVDVGRWLVGAPGDRPAQPRPRRGRLRRFGRGPCHRGVGGPCAGDGARASHRQVQQGRLGERDTGTQHPLRGRRNADPRVRVDGVQPGLDVRARSTTASAWSR